jgi:two-component system sensor histidine kinase DesK
MVVTAVFGGLCLIAMLHVLETTKSGTRLVLAAVAMAGLCSLQVFYLTRWGRRLGFGARFGVVAAQFLLAFPPFLVFGQSWVGMPGFVAGGALLTLPLPSSVVTFAVAVVGTAAIQFSIQSSPVLVAYTTVSTILTGLIVWGLSRMAIVVEELAKTRTEVARLAVFDERLRFARDLHDLLGYSLSAISLKSELTVRLVGKNSERALVELDEIREISRQALADVRQLANGYRDMSFEDEIRSARSVLLAADIEVTVNVANPPLPREVSTVLATVLREGITNLLQHSRAEHCDINVVERGRRVCLTIANDGAAQPLGPPSAVGGSGILNMSSRAGALGGVLSTSLGEGGVFRLGVELPLTVPERNGAVVPFRGRP